jgi:N-methylhydantoinase A
LAEAAAARLGERISIRDIYRLAEGVVRIVCVNMAGAVRQVSIERGHDPRDFALVAFGGAGPLHAIPIVQELGIPTVLAPQAPGNFCALGALVTDIKHDYIRTYKTKLNEEVLSRLETILREMQNQGDEVLHRDGVPENRRAFQFRMFLRYFGQAWELEIPVTVSPINLSEVDQTFNKEHLRAYGYNRPGHDIELVNLRVTAIGRIDRPSLASQDGASGSISAALREHRKIYFDGNFVDTPIYQRDLVPHQATIKGPAVIEEFGSVTIVFPGWTVTKDKIGNLVLNRAE